MYVRARTTFNHGGIVKMVAGEKLHVKDDIAKRLIDMGLVTEAESHKKIKIKRKEDAIEPVDEAKHEES